MSYRKILVPVFGAENDAASLGAAFGFARQFDAHVEALLVRLDPVSAVPYGYFGPDLSGYAAQYAIEAAIKASDEAQNKASGTFAKTVDKFGIEVTEKPGARPTPTAYLRIVQGDLVEIIERESRLGDLIVFGDDGHDRVREGLEAALLSGARPVVFAPHEATGNRGQNIAIAFDGSAAAAHAVTAAMPFLSRAKTVHSFEVTGEAGKSQALAELSAYLALRGIDAVEHVVDPGPKPVPEALVLAVQAQRCDLLVLGGYGHSRIREFVLGGVTRHVLQHPPAFAVLMAH